MTKGYQANKERLEAVNSFGKAVGKRAGFRCEWCEGRDDLRMWDYRPEAEPALETLAMLCRSCRDLADGRKASSDELRGIRNALWSDVPAVAESAAEVLSRCPETWVQEAIEESLIDDALKERLLAKTKIWK